jgi:hypothetical protein
MELPGGPRNPLRQHACCFVDQDAHVANLNKGRTLTARPGEVNFYAPRVPRVELSQFDSVPSF